MTRRSSDPLRRSWWIGNIPLLAKFRGRRWRDSSSAFGRQRAPHVLLSPLSQTCLGLVDCALVRLDGDTRKLKLPRPLPLTFASSLPRNASWDFAALEVSPSTADATWRSAEAAALFATTGSPSWDPISIRGDHLCAAAAETAVSQSGSRVEAPGEAGGDTTAASVWVQNHSAPSSSVSVLPLVAPSSLDYGTLSSLEVPSSVGIRTLSSLGATLSFDGAGGAGTFRPRGLQHQLSGCGSPTCEEPRSLCGSGDPIGAVTRGPAPTCVSTRTQSLTSVVPFVKSSPCAEDTLSQALRKHSSLESNASLLTPCEREPNCPHRGSVTAEPSITTLPRWVRCNQAKLDAYAVQRIAIGSRATGWTVAGCSRLNTYNYLYVRANSPSKTPCKWTTVTAAIHECEMSAVFSAFD